MLGQEIQDAAQGDGGRFCVDELGVATFKAATWLATDSDSTSVQATVTVANIQDIANTVDWSTLATGVIFEYTPRQPGGEQDIYRSQAVLVIPPGVKDIDIRFSIPNQGEWARSLNVHSSARYARIPVATSPWTSVNR